MDTLTEDWDDVTFPDNRLLIELCGEFDKHLTQIESHLGVQIIRRGNVLSVHGYPDERAAAQGVLAESSERLNAGQSLGHSSRYKASTKATYL